MDVSYSGTALSVMIQDTVTGRAASQSYPIDIPTAVGGTTVYVGFTGGTGYYTASQDVTSWDYLSWNSLPSPIVWTGEARRMTGATRRTGTSTASRPMATA